MRACVTRNGKEQHIRQQSLQVLLYFLEHRQRLIHKEELVETFWQNTAITDNALVQCIADIRRVVGDDSRNPRFIKTIPKVGYRFIADVEEQKPEQPVLSQRNPRSGLHVQLFNLIRNIFGGSPSQG